MDLIGIISAFIAVVAAGISYRSLKESRRLAKWATSYTRIVEAEKLVKDSPSILALHGVSEADLAKCGATPDEVVYLLQSFRAGQEWSRLSEAKTHSLSPYRKHMLSQEKTRCIWRNILKQRLIFDSPFVKAVDAYVSKTENTRD